MSGGSRGKMVHLEPVFGEKKKGIRLYGHGGMIHDSRKKQGRGWCFGDLSFRGDSIFGTSPLKDGKDLISSIN